MFSHLSTTRKAIDAKIAPLEAALSELRSQRNEVSPINQVPNEVMSDIFSIVKDMVMEDIMKLANSHYKIEWIIPSHVCRHWRLVALNTTELWCHLHFGKISPRWIQEMVARIQTAPFRLTIPYTCPAGSVALMDTVISQKALQLQDLQVTQNSESDLKAVMGIVSKSTTPILRSLDISLHYNSEDEGKTFDIPVVDGSMPQLRTLSISRFSIPWTSPLYKSLTTLQLRSFTKQLPPRADQFMSALSNMPHLVHLYLNFPLPDMNTLSPTLSTKRIPFPYLTSFTIAARRCILVAQFLDRIQFPSTTRLEFNVACRPVHLSAFFASISHVRRLTPSLSTLPGHGHPIVPLEIVLDGRNMSIQSLYDDSVAVHLELVFDTTRSVGPRSPGNDVTILLDPMLEPMSNHSEFYLLETTQLLSTSDWKRVLTSPPSASLRSLHLRSDQFLQFWEAFNADNQLPLGTPPIYLPNLRILTFYFINFDAKTTSKIRYGAVVLEMVDFLANRATRKASGTANTTTVFKTLYLRWCVCFSPHDIDSLKKLVDVQIERSRREERTLMMA